MIRNLKISIMLPKKELVPILVNALLPETLSPTISRSEVTIKSSEQYLLIDVKAKDLVALRATFNSYLRWVALILDVHKVLDQLETNNEKTLN